MVNGCRSKLVTVVSGVPRCSVLGPILFLLYTSERNLIGYADDLLVMPMATLIAIVPSPGVRITVAESLN